MRRTWRSWVLALLAGGVFFGGVIGLFNRQFSAGELYPEFSSMRTDRIGTKLLYDSLGRLPGITVARNFLPFEFLPRDGATLLLLGMDPVRVDWDDDLLKSAERIARRGNRVVLATWVDPERKRPEQKDFDRQEEPATAGPKKPERPKDPPIKLLWKVAFRIDPDTKNLHPLFFGQSESWTVRDQAGSKILAIERDFGKGSIVLMTESADFTNESMVAMDRLRQVSDALGAKSRIVFDEQHLGIAESGSVVGMARQFRLMGVALGLALCAGLFIWRNASGFPPPAARPGERLSGRTSQAGLLTLLKRHIPRAELAAVCWREWLIANRRELTPERQKQAEAIVADAARRPVEAAREIQALLHAKGEL